MITNSTFQTTTFNGTLSLASPSNRIPTCVDTTQYSAWGDAVNPINADSCEMAEIQLLQNTIGNAMTKYAFFSSQAYAPGIGPRRGWRLPYGASYSEWKRELIWDVHRE